MQLGKEGDKNVLYVGWRDQGSVAQPREDGAATGYLVVLEAERKEMESQVLARLRCVGVAVVGWVLRGRVGLEARGLDDAL